MARNVPAVGLFVVALFGCDSDAYIVQSALISAVPATVDFGVVPVGSTARRELVLANAGTLPTRVDGIVVEPATDVFRTTDDVMRLDPLQEHRLEITFAPVVGGEHAATLRVSSSADRGELDVVLKGSTESFTHCSTCAEPRPRPDPCGGPSQPQILPPDARNVSRSALSWDGDAYTATYAVEANGTSDLHRLRISRGGSVERTEVLRRDVNDVVVAPTSRGHVMAYREGWTDGATFARVDETGTVTFERRFDADFIEAVAVDGAEQQAFVYMVERSTPENGDERDLWITVLDDEGGSRLPPTQIDASGEQPIAAGVVAVPGGWTVVYTISVDERVLGRSVHVTASGQVGPRSSVAGDAASVRFERNRGMAVGTDDILITYVDGFVEPHSVHAQRLTLQGAPLELPLPIVEQIAAAASATAHRIDARWFVAWQDFRHDRQRSDLYVSEVSGTPRRVPNTVGGGFEASFVFNGCDAAVLSTHDIEGYGRLVFDTIKL